MNVNPNPQLVVLSIERYKELISLVEENYHESQRELLLRRVKRHARKFNTNLRKERYAQLVKDRAADRKHKQTMRPILQYPAYLPLPRALLTDVELFQLSPVGLFHLHGWEQKEIRFHHREGPLVFVSVDRVFRGTVLLCKEMVNDLPSRPISEVIEKTNTLNWFTKESEILVQQKGN